MTNPTNWPNPERPGVPMFPERSGRHHVGTHLLFWYSDIQQWVTVSPIRACKEPEDFAGDKYHGPILSPTQIAEMLAGERERVEAEMGAYVKNIMDAHPEWNMEQLYSALKEREAIDAAREVG